MNVKEFLEDLRFKGSDVLGFQVCDIIKHSDTVATCEILDNDGNLMFVMQIVKPT